MGHAERARNEAFVPVWHRNDSHRWLQLYFSVVNVTQLPSQHALYLPSLSAAEEASDQRQGMPSWKILRQLSSVYLSSTISHVSSRITCALVCLQLFSAPNPRFYAACHLPNFRALFWARPGRPPVHHLLCLSLSMWNWDIFCFLSRNQICIRLELPLCCVLRNEALLNFLPACSSAVALTICFCKCSN